MSTISKNKKSECPVKENTEETRKRLKTNLTFVSFLNEKFGLPDKQSRCTWTRNSDPANSPHRVQERRRTSKILPNALAAIGNTPMVKLNRIPAAEGLKCEVYAKCEYLNPGGSVKDRIGYRIVEDAELQGLLKPGSTIIEPTSGNTGIGIAMACAVKGYRCMIVMSEKMSNEKQSVLMALGAEIVRTPTTADSDSPEGLFGVCHKLRTEIPNSIILDQYSNPGNPLAHYDTTAEEIYDQCDKKVDMIVIGVGTGGTVTGISRKFKEISPETKIVGVDPVGSILAQPDSMNDSSVNFYEVEGIGYDFVPTVLDRDVVDMWIKTKDKESLNMARRLIKEEGLLVGSSSGAVLLAAIKAAKNLDAGKKVVILLPDSIRNYITKFVSDQWMEARDFKPCIDTLKHWWWNENVSVLKLENLQTATTSTTCDKLLNTIKKFGVDQMPVIDNNGGVIGMVTLQGLMKALISKSIESKSSIESCIIRIFPKLYKSANLGLVSRVLEKEAYVVILDVEGNGPSQIEKPVGIVTPVDLLQYISSK